MVPIIKDLGNILTALHITTIYYYYHPHFIDKEIGTER